MDPQLPRQGLQEDVAKLPPPLTIPQSLHPKCLAIKKHGAIFKESKMQQRTKSHTKNYQNNEREKRKVSLIEGNYRQLPHKACFCKKRDGEKLRDRHFPGKKLKKSSPDPVAMFTAFLWNLIPRLTQWLYKFVQ